jgi:hypothetical protein
MYIRWVAGFVIMATVVAFQTVGAEEFQQKKPDKVVIQGTILYADTGTPVASGKWFHVVEANPDGGIVQRVGKKLALASGRTDEKGFLRIEVDRSEFKDRGPFFHDNIEPAYTLISYAKNNPNLYAGKITSEKNNGQIYLFRIYDKDFKTTGQLPTINMNSNGRILYLFSKAFDSLEKIPVLNADVDSIQFFESGYDAPKKDQRTYKKRFARAEIRYINGELNLKYTAPGRRIDFVLEQIWKRVDSGKIIAHQKMDRYIDADWTSSYHNSGWGNKTPGAAWEPGTYALSVYVNGDPVSMDFFEVY